MRSFLIRNLALLFVILLASVLRLYKIGVVPPHLFADEVSNGYNAYSILKTGRDEYGNFLPLTFKSFGDYNPAFSVYTLVPAIAIFGVDQFSLRITSAVFGIAAVALTYFLSKKIFQSRLIAVLSALLLAISPWHLQFSRYDHEANFMQTLTLAAITTYLYFGKTHKGLIAAATLLGLALNTYHGAKIWIPIVILFLVVYGFKTISQEKKKLIIPALILLTSTIPITLNFQNALIRGQSVGIMKEKNKSEVFMEGYLSHFNPNFLFVNGDFIGRHAVTGMGELYVFEFPVILLGLIALVGSEIKMHKFFLGWLLLAPIPAALAIPTPHALRAITFLPVWQITAAIGIAKIISSKLKMPIKTIVLVTISTIAIYNFITYLHLYYVHYPRQRALDWQDGYRQVFEFIKSHQQDYTSIAISNYYAHPQIFLAFYMAYDPALYQKYPDPKKGFDKYEFFGPAWSKTKPGKALIVTPFWQAHPPKVLKEIYTTDRDLRFIISEEP